MATGEHRQALAFRTRDHHERPLQIDFFKSLITFLRQTDHAIASILEGFQRAIEIHNPRHGQMLQGTGGHFGDGPREPCAASLRQHHAVSSQGFSGTHNRTEIVGIGEAIECQQQRRFIELAAAIDQIRKIQRVCCSGLQSDALMHGTTSHLGKTRPGDLLDKHARGFGVPEQLHEFGSTAHLTGAPDAMDRTTSFQCRLGGMPAPEQIISHRISSMGNRFSAGLIFNLTISALATARANAAVVAITETTRSRTAIRETPVVRAMPLKALIAITAILMAPAFEAAITITTVSITTITLATVFKALGVETPVIRATVFKAAIFKTPITLTAVIGTAWIKAPVTITAVAPARGS